VICARASGRPGRSGGRASRTDRTSALLSVGDEPASRRYQTSTLRDGAPPQNALTIVSTARSRDSPRSPVALHRTEARPQRNPIMASLVADGRAAREAHSKGGRRSAPGRRSSPRQTGGGCGCVPRGRRPLFRPRRQPGRQRGSPPRTWEPRFVFARSPCYRRLSVTTGRVDLPTTSLRFSSTAPDRRHARLLRTALSRPHARKHPSPRRRVRPRVVSDRLLA
jgi:hypothetical protein